MAEKRTEKYVLEVEYEVWEEAGLTRQFILDAIFEDLPLIIPDEGGDEGAILQEATDLAHPAAAPPRNLSSTPRAGEGE